MKFLYPNRFINKFFIKKIVYKNNKNLLKQDIKKFIEKFKTFIFLLFLFVVLNINLRNIYVYIYNKTNIDA